MPNLSLILLSKINHLNKSFFTSDILKHESFRFCHQFHIPSHLGLHFPFASRLRTDCANEPFFGVNYCFCLQFIYHFIFFLVHYMIIIVWFTYTSTYITCLLFPCTIANGSRVAILIHGSTTKNQLTNIKVVYYLVVVGKIKNV